MKTTKLTKLVGNLVCVTPVVFGLTLVTTLAVRASEEFEPSGAPPITEAMQLSSEPIEVSMPDAADLIVAENAVTSSAPIFQTWSGDIAFNQWSVSNVAISDMNEINEMVEIGDQMEYLQAQSIQSIQSIQSNATLITLDAPLRHSEEPLDQEIANVLNNEEDNFHFASIDDSKIHLEFAKISTENPLSQVTPEPGESEPEPIPEESNEPAAPPWRFIFQPYGFVPLSVEGNATVRDLTSEINLGLDDVLNPLNFAAAGRLEAWRGNLGFIVDAAYFSIEQDSSTSRSGLDCLNCIFPSEINTETKARYGQFDLGVGYRFAAVNPSETVTEFDLGPLVLDAIVGLRVYAFQAEIDVSTNLGTSRNRERSKTIVEPLISGRIRWNVSPNLAGWVRGDIAGLGIQGTVFAAAFTGGLEWMFSGNTSLLIAYRISSLQYASEDDLELNLLLHGPYLGMIFRF